MLSRRPFGVTLLLWMVLSLSAWGLVRLAATLRWWDVLSEFKASLSPLYLSITGAGWAVAGAVLLWSLWSAKAWSRLAILTSIILWLTEYWIERLFFQLPRPNSHSFHFAATAQPSRVAARCCVREEWELAFGESGIDAAAAGR